MSAPTNNFEFVAGCLLIVLGLIFIMFQIKTGEWKKPIPPASTAALKIRAASVGVIILGIHFVFESYVHHS
jgi:hypothetical protein